MKILTFNHHESYISLLAETGHQFYVVTKKGSLDLKWGTDRIPCPENVVCIEWDSDLQNKIKQGQFNLIIAHTIKNLIWLLGIKTPIVFIAHIPLFTKPFLARIKSFLKKSFLRFFMQTHTCNFVCITPWKSKTWGIKGTIIEPTFNPFPPISNSETLEFKIALVCNHLKQRREELGWSIVKQVLEEFPLKIIGNNPEVPESIKMNSFQEFQTYLQNFNVYFYPIQIPFGDGYNLALLEAMSMGMTPVTLFNPSSPIVHMKNGLVAHNYEELKLHLNYLKSHPEEIKRLGLAAKNTVENRFSKKLFIEKWQNVLLQKS